MAPLLEAGLDPPIIARLTGRSVRTAERWASGSTAPRGSARQRLLAVEAILDALGAALPGADAASWLGRPNAELDFATPAELIESGESRRVLALLTAVGEGVFL